MKNAVRQVLFSTLMPAVLAGCCGTVQSAGRQTAEPAFFATLEFLSNEAWPPRIHAFGGGDAIAIVVQGYDGQAVTIEIRDVPDGKLVDTSAEFIPEGFRRTFMPTCPGCGSYAARLVLRGAVVQDWSYSIR